PMFTQHQYHLKLETGGPEAAAAEEYMKSHSHFFTFGLNIGKSDCRIPQFDFIWHTTKKPICLNHWNRPFTSDSDFGFTSVMNWTERPDFMYEGESWGQKNKEFKKFYDLPAATNQKFEIIINRPKDDATSQSMDYLRSCGWQVLSPDVLISDMRNYKSFVQSSFAEFSITKETYVKSNSGWFSGRSAVYLASGRPVITQDTRWSSYIPSGDGAIAIHDFADAVEAVNEVTKNYEHHSKAAKSIALEYFDSHKVLGDMLKHI
ncbi:MAG: hypothetical protein M3R25_01935, partial [Bacteroidota bacterium]|nr:hypothetical protein [Bacteroidota bacterium]